MPYSKQGEDLVEALLLGAELHALHRSGHCRSLECLGRYLFE
ncbi:hypothetical protein CEXT_574061, partial [Caerostris extrusa]